METKCDTCGCVGGNGTWLTTWKDGTLRSVEACPVCHDCTDRCFQCLLRGWLSANKCSVVEKHKHKDCVCVEHRPPVVEQVAETDEQRCVVRDSNGIQCEVKGKHEKHAAPRHLEAWLKNERTKGQT